MTHLLQIITLLQMALSLLTTTQNMPNAPETLKREVINFSNQAITLALKEINNIAIQNTFVSNPIQIGSQKTNLETLAVPTPVIPIIQTPVIPAVTKTEIEFMSNGRIKNSTPYPLFIEGMKIVLSHDGIHSEITIKRVDGMVLSTISRKAALGDGPPLDINLKYWEIKSYSGWSDTLLIDDVLSWRVLGIDYKLSGGNIKKITIPDGQESLKVSE